MCPRCHAELVGVGGCGACGAAFGVLDGVPVLIADDGDVAARDLRVSGGALPTYDCAGMGVAAIDEAQLDASADAVIALIEGQLAEGIAQRRIVLAGFSQGGAVVLHTGYLRWPGELGGVMALSTYGPTFDDDLQLPEAKKQQPALCLHGTYDDVVAPAMGRAAYDFLLRQGVAAQWRDYPMAHEVSNQEIADIGAWLRERL